MLCEWIPCQLVKILLFGKCWLGCMNIHLIKNVVCWLFVLINTFYIAFISYSLKINMFGDVFILLECNLLLFHFISQFCIFWINYFTIFDMKGIIIHDFRCRSICKYFIIGMYVVRIDNSGFARLDWLLNFKYHIVNFFIIGMFTIIFTSGKYNYFDVWWRFHSSGR